MRHFLAVRNLESVEGLNEHADYHQEVGWIGHHEGLAAAYSMDRNGIIRLDAVIQYAPVTLKVLHSISVRRLENPKDYEDSAHWPTFPPGPPPTHDELITAWKTVRDEEPDVTESIFDGHTPIPQCGPVKDSAWLAKKPGEPAEDFYRRIAAAYTEYGRSTSRPVKHLAFLAGVGSSTAHSWVYKARIRGFLPPVK